MSDSAQYLKSLATHFATSDWNYTRKTGIKHVRYFSDSTGRDRLDRRLASAVASLFEKNTLSSVFSPKTLKDKFYFRLAGFIVRARMEPHLPDGVLNGGSVITYWEEDGEYLQMVQPTVGELLADFLIEEPNHPHAVKITAELDRLRANYQKRIDTGEVE